MSDAATDAPVATPTVDVSALQAQVLALQAQLTRHLAHHVPPTEPDAATE